MTGVQLEVFVDFLCPDCAAAFPTLKRLAAHYLDSLQLTIHPFPLPYHVHGFLAAKSVHVVASANSAKVFLYAQILWDHVDELNAGSQNLTVIQAEAELGALASFAMSPDKFLDGMRDVGLELETRVAWKYACTRGVYGTPTFFLNGVLVSASPTWSVGQWRKLIDPIVAGAPAR